VFGDDPHLAVVGDEHVDVVPKDRRQREVPLLGDLSEGVELLFRDPEGDGLVLVTHGGV